MEPMNIMEGANTVDVFSSSPNTFPCKNGSSSSTNSDTSSHCKRNPQNSYSYSPPLSSLRNLKLELKTNRLSPTNSPQSSPRRRQGGTTSPLLLSLNNRPSPLGSRSRSTSTHSLSRSRSRSRSSSIGSPQRSVSGGAVSIVGGGGGSTQGDNGILGSLGAGLGGQFGQQQEQQQLSIIVDPYHILGIRRDANHKAVVQAYRRLALLNHPHRHPSPTINRERNNRLNFGRDSAGSSGVRDQAWNGFHQPQGAQNHDRQNHNTNIGSTVNAANNINSTPSPNRSFSTINNKDSMTKEKMSQQLREWKFLVISASYETLSNQKHRRRYDLLISRINMKNSDSESGGSSIRRWKKKQPSSTSPSSLIKAKKLWGNLKKGLEITDSFEQEEKNRRQQEQKEFDFSQCHHPQHHHHLPPPAICGGHDSSIAASSLSEAYDNPPSPLRYSYKKSPTSSAHKKQTFLLQCKALYLSEDEEDKRRNQGGIAATSEDLTDDEEDEKNGSQGKSGCVREETDQLFGGPLARLYKARNHAPFLDAYALFEKEFGRDIFRSCIDSDEEEDDMDCGSEEEVDLNHSMMSPSPTLDSGMDLPQIPRITGVEYGSPSFSIKTMTREQLGPSTSMTSFGDQSMMTLDRYRSRSNSSATKRKLQNMDSIFHHDPTIPSTPERKQTNKLPTRDKEQASQGYPTLPIIPLDILAKEGLIDINEPTPSTKIGTSKFSLSPSTRGRGMGLNNSAGKDQPIVTIETNKNVTVKKLTRIVNGTKMVRVERTTIDPSTGKSRTVIEVNREEVGEDDIIQNKREEEDLSSPFLEKHKLNCCGKNTTASWDKEGAPVKATMSQKPTLTGSNHSMNDDVLSSGVAQFKLRSILAQKESREDTSNVLNICCGSLIP